MCWITLIVTVSLWSESSVIREDKRLVSAYADNAGYSKTRTRLPLVVFDSESLGSYKLTATPTTLLINEDGRVEHAWIGKWDETKAREVAAALK